MSLKQTFWYALMACVIDFLNKSEHVIRSMKIRSLKISNNQPSVTVAVYVAVVNL